MSYNTACKEWWAAVVYNAGKSENVPVGNIKKFAPANLMDFSVHKIYKIKSVKWNKGGNQRYLGFIQRLAETEDDLIASLEAKRPCRPKTRFDLTDGPVSSTDCEERSDLVTAERESKNKKDKNKREADLEWASFNINRRLKVGPITNKSATCQPGSGGSSKEELREKIKALERELGAEKRRRIAAEERSNELAALADITKKLEMVEEKLRKMSDDKSRNNASPSSSVRAVVEPNLGEAPSETVAAIAIDDKVTLGEGFSCLLSSWRAMKEAKSVVDWCVALLRGVFGEEAKFYRVQPRKSSINLKPFPKAFLEIAKVHFKVFPMKIKYDALSIDSTVQRLPGMLSNRATDMIGRRSKN